MSKEVVLAFSGGLDTSFCVPYLRERGLEVVTLFVDTGGVSDDEKKYIASRARELGAKEHVEVDAGESIWRDVVVPLVQGGSLYQAQYPLLCSDRYLIVQKSLELADRRGTKRFAHGCTGMGNDQVRFDVSVRALGDYEILAPIRDIQEAHSNVREHEQRHLESLGFPVRAKTTKYSINANLLGVTASGGEIDRFEAPGEETWQMCAPPAKWPREGKRVTIGFERGVAVSLDGKATAGPEILRSLNGTFGAYGVGRGIYTGDTTIGLKGRIVFECPGITALLTAHRALEETVLTARQNAAKPKVAAEWVDLVYKGLFFEPLKQDLEAFLASTQTHVTGEVVLETHGGAVHAVAVRSANILKDPKSVYAQSAAWTAAHAEGFIRLFGQSTTMAATIHRQKSGG